MLRAYSQYGSVPSPPRSVAYQDETSGVVVVMRNAAGPTVRASMPEQVEGHRQVRGDHPGVSGGRERGRDQRHRRDDHVQDRARAGAQPGDREVAVEVPEDQHGLEEAQDRRPGGRHPAEDGQHAQPDHRLEDEQEERRQEDGGPTRRRHDDDAFQAPSCSPYPSILHPTHGPRRTPVRLRVEINEVATRRTDSPVLERGVRPGTKERERSRSTGSTTRNEVVGDRTYPRNLRVRGPWHRGPDTTRCAATRDEARGSARARQT